MLQAKIFKTCLNHTTQHFDKVEDISERIKLGTLKNFGTIDMK